MKILIIHPNFPGQYKHIARTLAEDKENQVVALCRFESNNNIKGVKKILYRINRKPAKETHSYVRNLEESITFGQALWRVCNKLKLNGFIPDIICGHIGWGDGLFLKDIFPHTPILSYMEFYYHAFGADINFYPDDKVNPDAIAKTRIRNAVNLLNLESCDWAISPTIWQKSLHPKEFHSKISVLHEGIDTEFLKPYQGKNLNLPGGVKLQYGDEIVTYVARNFEPYRGFPNAMKAIAIIQRDRPNAHVLIVGSDGVSYGAKLAEGKTYKQIMLEQVTLDSKRTHWLGKLPYDQYIKVLQYSAAHIYLTVPFVLSWSLLEAMAVGCAVVCSDTQPVREVINDGKNGLLADFFSPEDIAMKVGKVLNDKKRMSNMRLEARKTIENKFALKDILPLHMKLISDIAAKKTPPPSAKEIREFYEAKITGKKKFTYQDPNQ